ncbi:MAG TPA: hypothetical protein VE379_10070 [Vicinamibacterales bacterium]|jgi:hypothetical protein|nr:hypothetical protein [Vicinamibacterales bacterium]
MAKQGNRGGKQGSRDREGNFGQGGRDVNNPTGTSGRQDKTTDQRQDNDAPGSERSRRQDSDDDDSPLGARNTNR